MAKRKFEVEISADVEDFSRGMNRAEDEASGLGDTLSNEVSSGANEATDSLKTITKRSYGS